MSGLEKKAEANKMVRKSFTAIIFPIADEFYAFDLNDIKEVIALSALTPLPNVPPHIIGIIPHRSELLTIIDLGIFFQPFDEKRLNKNYIKKNIVNTPILVPV